MLHLVCPSRTPPSSPKPPRSHGNKPQENSASPAVGQPRTQHLSIHFITTSFRFIIHLIAVICTFPCGLKKLTCLCLMMNYKPLLIFRTLFSAYRPLKTLIALLSLLKMASRLQERAVMGSGNEPDPSLTTRRTHNLCTGTVSTCVSEKV